MRINPNPKQRVLVNVILDKSGSMGSKTSDVIHGFNAYLEGLSQEDAVEYFFSLTLFDTAVEYRQVAVPLPRVDRLDTKSYRPGGNTALNDAIGTTVRKVEADRGGYEKVVTVIMTDGEENSSREWTASGVKTLIEQKEKEDGWTFVFLGAAPDAWNQGAAYGIRAANVAQYSTAQHVDAFACLAQGTNAVASAPGGRSENLFASVARNVLRKSGIRQPGDEKP